ncbi:MAG: prolipoprotein diacylglyceryl transferase [Bacilli bacterium]|nr:prolipoprotein diacylglyceryl transferase [Bacilli bacterium]
MVLFIIFALATLVAGFYGFYQTKKLISTEMIDVDFGKIIKKTLIYDAIVAVCLTVMSVGIVVWKSFPVDGLHWFKLIAGALSFAFALTTAIHFFIYYYYGKNIDETWKKKIFYSFIGLFVAAFLALFLWLDGFAPYLTYPLVNGISFDKGFVNPTGARPNIAFYAICILSGAILVYFMCDHFMYKEYKVHGILESTFFVAFPAGIIGARLWYCIGDGVPIQDWIKIWQGGLTILGGALMGIIVGVAWFLWKNKKYSIWVAVDLIVPTILIAQAVGRFGNFFNCEVHGLTTSVDNFKWLPEIIRNNMMYSERAGYAPEGMMYVPLFFIEALVNFFGYFVIAHLLGKKLRKITEPGDLAFAYIIWYGATRVIMEPFRHSAYNMGENGYWSWIWSLLFVLVGTLLIIANHVVRYIIKKRKNNYIVQKGDKKLGLVETICFGVIGVGAVIPAIVLMASNSFNEKIGFAPFNIGLMLFALGFSVLLLIVPAVLRLVEARKVKNA